MLDSAGPAVAVDAAGAAELLDESDAEVSVDDPGVLSEMVLRECLELLCAPPVLLTFPVSEEAARREPPVDLAWEPDEPASAELPPSAPELAADPVDWSARATPQPDDSSAAPTPSATANPPTRPTNLEAPMFFFLLRIGDRHLSGD
ncbi:hypothetical protein MANY_35330 [Mycolicibacterium anyangense]|uniref:Uncharacterized protein n=1 Tax=Mycolicibacterium anyangense TaxID=1431246 RepID=A0A6N4W8B8_9MYCO|nr:hypothetical protein MANY_35330 [Mycolicibacterium anyangense]